MARHSHPLESALKWGSAGMLSFAAGFFVRVAVGGADEMLALAGSLCAALAAGAAALAIFHRVEVARWPRASFAPPPIDALVDDPPIEDGDELLLTDPLGAPSDDSRVVRLFAPETIHVPGELASRIDQWIEGARSRLGEQQSDHAVDGHGPSSSPASAALHAALADIRRSLG